MPDIRSIRCSKCNKWFRTNVTRRVCALCRYTPVYKQRDNLLVLKVTTELVLEDALKDLPDFPPEKRFKSFEKLWD